MRRRKRFNIRKAVERLGAKGITAGMLEERIRKEGVGHKISLGGGIPDLVKTEEERLAVIKNRSFVRKSPVSFQMELGKKMEEVKKELVAGETKTVRVGNSDIILIRTKKGIEIVERII